MRFVLTLAFCLTSAHVHAGVATVITTADSGPGSLRDVVALGASVVFAPTLNGSTILLTSGQITITNSMGIDASMLPDGITISGNRSSRIFQIESGNTVILDTLTIVDGRAPGGAGVQSDGNLTMRNCTLSRNQSSPLQAGGGLRTFDAQVTLDKCTFDQNRAT